MLPLTARIERAPFHRARSASKKGTWPLPPHPSEAARCASTEDHQSPSHSLFRKHGDRPTYPALFSGASRQATQTGQPTRPQASHNRRRTLRGTLRIVTNRERSWGPFSGVSRQAAQTDYPARPQPKNRPEAYPLGYVEDLFEARTQLGVCFSSLPRRRPCWRTSPSSCIDP